jgi:signal transduction histidine kinase
VKRSAIASLRHRAVDISDTLALIMRSRRLVIPKESIENWLNELVKQGEVESIELFNAAGEPLVVAPAQAELPKGELTGGDYWDEKAETLTLINPVTLPTNILVSPGDLPTNAPPRPETDGAAGGPPPGSPPPGGPPPGGPPPGEGPPPGGPPPGQDLATAPPPASVTNSMMAASGTNSNTGTNNQAGPRRGGPRRRLSAEEIKALSEKKGTHGFIMVMSGKALHSTVMADLWLRAFIGLLASISVAGYGLAWSNAAKTSELQIRLVRASELNSHLKEMNLAAAGLAHETRNPLNIVRGLAQMLSKQDDAPPEIRIKAREIIDETDRVAAQLNEFINYSRPREVRRAATRLNSVVTEVARALNYDLEEKKAKLQNLAEDLTIEADEQLLRQALFNLVLNAIQAAPAGGEISVRTGRQNNEAFIEIADNGPGVAAEHRAEIFRPYFTTHEEGTGLGLAVVQQIVLAHGWEIECLPNTPKGACFRITHVKLAARS